MISIDDDWIMGFLVANKGGHYVSFDANNLYFAQDKYAAYALDEKGGGAQALSGWFSYGSKDSKFLTNHSQDIVLSGIVSDVRVDPKENLKIMLESLRVIKDHGKIPLIVPFYSESYEEENVDRALRLYKSYGFDKKVEWKPLGQRKRIDQYLTVTEIYEI